MFSDEEQWFIKRFFGASDFYLAQFLTHYYREPYEKQRTVPGEVSEFKKKILEEEKLKCGLLFW